MNAPYTLTAFPEDTEISGQNELIFSVSEYLSYLNIALKPLNRTIQGEIGKIDRRGQAVYFTLCDKKEKAVINCFSWQNTLRNIGFEIEEGMEVKIIGYPEVYKPFGKLSLQVQYILPIGEGALKIAFEKLKIELDKAGYFGSERKRTLPQFPQRIGLITSEQGVVITDFLTGLGNHGFQIIFHDVRVEGMKSLDMLLCAIKLFNELANPIDVLVIARGGGSLESLQPFNSVEIAKAIYGSKIPVLTAIGHERDVTIADLVADVRASVPLHAGKLLSEPWIQIELKIDAIEDNMMARYKHCVLTCLTKLTYFQKNLTSCFGKHLYHHQKDLHYHQTSITRCFKDMLQKIQHIESAFSYNFHRYKQNFHIKIQNFQFIDNDLQKDAKQWYYQLLSTIKTHEEQLSLCDPQIKLKQGYCIIRDSLGRVIKSTKHVHHGELVTIQLSDGNIQSEIKEVKV